MLTKKDSRRIKECEKEIMTAATIGSRVIARRQSSELTPQDADTVARIDRIIERNIAEIKRIENREVEKPTLWFYSPNTFRPVQFFSIEVTK